MYEASDFKPVTVLLICVPHDCPASSLQMTIEVSRVSVWVSMLPATAEA